MHTDNVESPVMAKALALLQKFYGYRSFNPGQREIIESVMSRRDTLVLMPTGGGKSLCYQLPAIMSDGCCVVISPLISLMNDQVMGLNAIGIPAAAINSDNTDSDNRTAMELAYQGKLKLLYMSPERLMSEMERNDFSRWVSFFAIDEAHCISQWGHDFRPEYTRLSTIRTSMPSVPIIALTATADKLTRDDIARQLNLTDPMVYISSFDRPNISLTVMANPGKRQKIALITSLIDRNPDDAGIIYCLSRKGVENMCAELVSLGYKALPYHAGLPASVRKENQQKFISGEINVVVATVAFGMGIDKSNVRWVIHNNMPQNMESYYQEIGRAGRDGAPAEALMFHSFADYATISSFIEESGRPAINTEKLIRMKDYCESTVCRRRVLLSYFNEVLDHDCGNCDICKNPPERFDGTTLAQMALSAIVRTQEKVGVTLLIDILRGSARAEVLEHGYDKIKTYGVGRMLPFAEWNIYLSQMLQLGVFDIDYADSNHLKLTPFGWKILKGETGLPLARHYRKTGMSKAGTTKQHVPASKRNPAEQLFSELKALRLVIAKSENIPPYLVFTDKTLMEMVKHRPVTLREFNRIDGVGEKKSVKYWSRFTSLIKRYK